MAQVSLVPWEGPALLWAGQLREGLYWDVLGGGGDLLEACQGLTACGKSGLIKIKGIPVGGMVRIHETREWMWFAGPLSL